MAEFAIPLVRKLVGARRRYGIAWDASFTDAGLELGISPWRCRTLYYRLAGIRPVLFAEWNRLRERGALMLRQEAARLRRFADELDAEADALESGQSNYPRSDGCEPAPGDAALREAAD
jgi:hypothetical protein